MKPIIAFGRHFKAPARERRAFPKQAESLTLAPLTATGSAATVIRSMTAFARREAQEAFGHLSWELRSLNHRYLEISPHLPEDLRSLEPELRARVGDRLGRGKVDCTLKFRPTQGEAGTELSLNRSQAEQLVSVHAELARLLGYADQQPSASELLRWPGVVQEAEPDLAPVRQRALGLLDDALDDLLATREREGARLAEMVLDRLQRLEVELEKVRDMLPEVRQAFRDRLRSKLDEVAGELEPGRLEQELALFAQKMDVDEELDRALTHATEIRRVLEADEPVGRRLDFLMQELNREANTLGAKSVDPRLSQAAVEMKVLIEQMREQVQNIE